MLREIRDVKQYEDEDKRRWFTDDYWDLYVWINKQDEITGLQICYDKSFNEHALTWRRGSGFTHTKIDDGERNPTSHMAPILVRDGLFDKDKLAKRFKADSAKIDPKVAKFVLSRILKYPR